MQISMDKSHTIRLSELLSSSSDDLAISQYTVSGILYSGGSDKVWLAPDNSEEHRYEQSVKIFDLELFDTLLDNVPVYVGGKYIYKDFVEMTCFVRIEEGSIVIDKASKVIIKRGKDVYSFDKEA